MMKLAIAHQRSKTMTGRRTDGLEDVIAAQSAITSVDGQKGELRYRGYAIGELAERCSFEQVAYLLWQGELPNDDQLDELTSELRQLRSERMELLELLPEVPPRAHPLDVLR